MRDKIGLPYKFRPLDYQERIFSSLVRGALTEGGIKRALWIVHRRGGKDKVMFNALVAVAASKMANYVYYFPTAALGRKALWDNIDVLSGMKVIDHIPKEIIAKAPNQTRMEIRLVNGSTIQIASTKTLDVVGGNFYGVVFSESAQHNPEAWSLTQPILSQNGGFAWLNGTPRGRNWIWRLKNKSISDSRWYTETLTNDDTHVFTDEQIQAERVGGMSEQMIRQEYYCDFNVGQPGAIYSVSLDQQRSAGRVSDNILYDKSRPLYTAWDIGSAHNTKCWVFQVVQDRIKFIESLSGGIGCETPNDWASRLLNKRYRFERHFLPHDGATIWKRLMLDSGFGSVSVLPRPLGTWDNIRMATSSFSRCDFNETGCADGLDALDDFHCSETNDGNTISENPVHNWSSHYSTAFGYAHQAIKSGIISDNWGFSFSNDRNSLIRKSLVRGQECFLQTDTH